VCVCVCVFACVCVYIYVETLDSCVYVHTLRRILVWICDSFLYVDVVTHLSMNSKPILMRGLGDAFMCGIQTHFHK